MESSLWRYIRPNSAHTLVDVCWWAKSKEPLEVSPNWVCELRTRGLVNKALLRKCGQYKELKPLLPMSENILIASEETSLSSLYVFFALSASGPL